MVNRIKYADTRGSALIEEYADECALQELGLLPNPQWDMYAALEQAGVLQALAVYADEQMAGFAGVLMAPNPHFGVKMATVESFFVGKEFRPKGAGTTLNAAIREMARSHGCKAIIYHARAGSVLEEILGKRSERTGSVWCLPLD